MDYGNSRAPEAVIAALQAAQIAHATLLQAMIATHPNPDALKAMWARLVPARAADAVQDKAAGKPGNVTNHFLLEAFQDWTGYLEKYSARP